MNFLNIEDIFKFSKAKSDRDFNNECQCTCDECGDECNPYYKRKEIKETLE